MAEITAKLVNELRARTGLPMMDCKKALVETAGDLEKAFDYFRKKGVKTSVMERAANEGRVDVAVSADRKRGVAVEINCNTDFTAKSEPIAKINALAAEKLLKNPSVKLADDPAIKDAMVNVAQQTGENVQVGRSVTLETQAGTIASYLYSTGGKGKIAVLIAVTGKADDDLVRNLGMHIAAAKPVAVALSRKDVAPELLAREKDIAIEQAKASGKPQEIAEKIATGKLNSFYAENVLLEQEIVNADFFKGSVAALLKSRGADIEKYVRLAVGQ